MKTQIRSLSVVLVSVALVNLCPDPCLAQQSKAKGPSDADVQVIKTELDRQVKVLQGNKVKVKKKLEVVNQIESMVNDMVEGFDINDLNSVEATAKGATAYRQAIIELESAAKDFGYHVQRSSKEFELVKSKEGQGELPAGTLTKKYKETQELSRLDFEAMEKAIERARKESQNINKGLGQKGLTIQDLTGTEVGLVVVSQYLPDGSFEFGATRTGFAIIVNFDRKVPHSGVMKISKVSGSGDISPKEPQTITVPPGGARKLTFTITVTDTMEYLPYFEQTK